MSVWPRLCWFGYC